MKLMNNLTRALAGFAFLVSTSIFAVEVKPYLPADFKAAQAAGKPAVLDFHANWCSTCKKQKAVIESLKEDPKLKDLVVFQANFDLEKSLKKDFKVTKQSTLVVFKGAQEVARATGITSREDISKLLVKGTVK